MRGAVRCAVKVQQQVPVCDGDYTPDRTIRFRIGINVGDVIPDGLDVHGDVVNVAGSVSEWTAVNGGIETLTEITVADIEICGTAELPAPTALTYLPMARRALSISRPGQYPADRKSRRGFHRNSPWKPPCLNVALLSMRASARLATSFTSELPAAFPPEK